MATKLSGLHERDSMTMMVAILWRDQRGKVFLGEGMQEVDVAAVVVMDEGGVDMTGLQEETTKGTVIG